MLTSKTPIKVKNGRKQCSQYKRQLKKFGLSNSGAEWTGVVTDRKFKKIIKFCAFKGLKYEINNSFGKRSTTYRSTYFKHNKPVFKNLYICAYCGGLFSRSKITVDHLYPVAQVNKKRYLQKKLKSMGAKDVNDYQNLVAACYTCNTKKSSKMGSWVIRGRLGKNKKLWGVRWGVRIVIMTTIVLYLATYIQQHNLIIRFFDILIGKKM